MSAANKLCLNCLVFGEDPSRVFMVQIAETADVDDLKELIKQERANTFRKVDAIYLDLYDVSLSIDDELDGKLKNLALNAPPLHRARKLSDIFVNLAQMRIHIIVGPLPPPGVGTPLLRAEGQDDILTMLAESFKRTITLMSESLTPSQLSEVGNPVNTAAPPIQLFNPAFAYFSSKAFDPEYNVPNDLVCNVRELMVRFAGIHATKDARRNHLRPFLQKAIRHPLVYINNSNRTTVDLVGLSSCGELPVYLIVDEEQNEFGSRGSDPSEQATSSFLRIFNQEENSELRLKCCCPTFIMAHAGPWLTIMGGVITTDCIVQQLTDFLWVPVHSMYDDHQCYRIARVLYALRESIQRLDSWYKTIEDVAPFKPSAPTAHPRFFPSPDTYRFNDAPVKFEYQGPLEQDISCVTYLAKTLEDSPKDIVVKFVTSYGLDAHQKMASTGFAPQLLYYGPINVTPDMPSYGKLRMVVMEYVKGLTFKDAVKWRRVPSTFKADLHRAIEQLHGTGYVYGNLRQSNVIVTPERTHAVQLIGFDWAGKEGEADYPISIPSSIDWPAGVQGLEPIRKEHDLAMLDRLMSQL